MLLVEQSAMHVWFHNHGEMIATSARAIKPNKSQTLDLSKLKFLSAFSALPSQ